MTNEIGTHMVTYIDIQIREIINHVVGCFSMLVLTFYIVTMMFSSSLLVSLYILLSVVITEKHLHMLDIYDKNLAVDEFEIYVSETISSMLIYGVCKILSGPDIASKKEEIKVYLNSAYVKAKIKIMTDAIHGDTDLALGTAKELIETCCKSILKEKKIEYDKNWDLPKLFKETISQLSFVNLVSVENPEQASKSIKQIISGCNNIIQGVAELRNAYGSGHGKDKDFKALPIPYVKFAVASVSDIILFLLQINGENTEIIEYNEK